MSYSQLEPSNKPKPFFGGDDEISFRNILSFLRAAYKTILAFGMLGLLFSVVYLSLTPKKYEAIAQITMAQIGSSGINNIGGGNNNINPLGVNVEEPALLVSRLASPTSFPSSVTEICGYQDRSDAGLMLSKSIVLTVPKGLNSVIELKAFGRTSEAAKACALAVFELIKLTQSQIIAPYIEEAKIKLADDEERLARAKDFVAKADKSGSVMGAAYLSTRDEIRYLLDEITALKNVVTSNQNRSTRLLAPVYVGEMPISPKKRMVFAFGLMVGLLFGLLISLARQAVFNGNGNTGLAP